MGPSTNAHASYPSNPPTPNLGSAAGAGAALSGSSAGTGLSGKSKQQQLLEAIAGYWEIPYDKIQLGDMIGKGSSGMVWGVGLGWRQRQSLLSLQQAISRKQAICYVGHLKCR